jgi:hypothetical protein
LGAARVEEKTMSAARIAVLASLTLLSACDSAVEPASPAQEAIHFDALAGAACSSGDSRCFYLRGFAIPLAFGATPSVVQLDSGPNGPSDGLRPASFKWRGFVYDSLYLNPDGSVLYEAGAFMLFSDTNLTSALVFKRDSLGAFRLPEWFLLRDRTVQLAEAYSSGAGDTAVATLGTCATPPRLTYTALPVLTAADECRIRTFSVSYDMAFADVTIDISRQSVNGVQVVFRH